MDKDYLILCNLFTYVSTWLPPPVEIAYQVPMFQLYWQPGDDYMKTVRKLTAVTSTTSNVSFMQGKEEGKRYTIISTVHKSSPCVVPGKDANAAFSLIL